MSLIISYTGGPGVITSAEVAWTRVYASDNLDVNRSVDL